MGISKSDSEEWKRIEALGDQAPEWYKEKIERNLGEARQTVDPIDKEPELDPGDVAQGLKQTLGALEVDSALFVDGHTIQNKRFVRIINDGMRLGWLQKAGEAGDSQYTAYRYRLTDKGVREASEALK